MLLGAKEGERGCVRTTSPPLHAKEERGGGFLEPISSLSARKEEDGRGLLKSSPCFQIRKKEEEGESGLCFYLLPPFQPFGVHTSSDDIMIT